MKCCETKDCEQGKLCPERTRYHAPIELQQLPSSRAARRQALWGGLLLALVITLATASAVSLVVNIGNLMGASA